MGSVAPNGFRGRWVGTQHSRFLNMPSVWTGTVELLSLFLVALSPWWDPSSTWAIAILWGA